MMRNEVSPISWKSLVLNRCYRGVRNLLGFDMSSSARPKLLVIGAISQNKGIGKNGTLPWTLKKEMAYFARMTKTATEPGKRNAVIMGRNTWLGIPEKNRPLKDRLNIIISTTMESTDDPDVRVCRSLEDVLDLVSRPPLSDALDRLWVIGGEQVYEATLQSACCHRVYLTRIFKEYDCDRFFPDWDPSAFDLIGDQDVPEDVQDEGGILYKYEVYQKKSNSSS